MNAFLIASGYAFWLLVAVYLVFLAFDYRVELYNTLISRPFFRLLKKIYPTYPGQLIYIWRLERIVKSKQRTNYYAPYLRIVESKPVKENLPLVIEHCQKKLAQFERKRQQYADKGQVLDAEGLIYGKISSKPQSKEG